MRETAKCRAVLRTCFGNLCQLFRVPFKSAMIFLFIMFFIPVKLCADDNNITMLWYDDGELLDVSSSASNCTYSEAINLPETPTKPGYTFEGWKVAQWDFSTLPLNATGTEAYSKGKISSDAFCCYYDSEDQWYSSRVLCNNNSVFSDLQKGGWKVFFDYGTIYGTSLCSSTSSTFTRGLENPAQDNGQYCWCKATGYKPIDSSVKYVPSEPFIWTFALNRNTSSDCATYCPNTCARYVEKNTGSFGRVILTQTRR